MTMAGLHPAPTRAQSGPLMARSCRGAIPSIALRNAVIDFTVQTLGEGIALSVYYILRQAAPILPPGARPVPFNPQVMRRGEKRCWRDAGRCALAYTGPF